MPTFDELQELADVVSRHKVNKIDVLGNPGKAATLFETAGRTTERVKIFADIVPLVPSPAPPFVVTHKS